MKGSGDGWAAAVVARLVELRLAGAESFDIAWSLATETYPPPGGRQPQLFDEQGQRSLTLAEFTRRACEDAWHDVRGPAGSGSGPALRHFRPGWMMDVVLSPELMAA